MGILCGFSGSFAAPGAARSPLGPPREDGMAPGSRSRTNPTSRSHTAQLRSHQHLCLPPRLGSKAKPRLCGGSAQHPSVPSEPSPTGGTGWGTGPGPTSPGEGCHPGTSPWPWEQKEQPLAHPGPFLAAAVNNPDQTPRASTGKGSPGPGTGLAQSTHKVPQGSGPALQHLSPPRASD